MRMSSIARQTVVVMSLCLSGAAAQAQQRSEPFQPESGQAGKDVVWVPTPPEMVEAMLDLAKVTPQDFVMDLGSGDGRNIIAAARRGARALGVEYNPDMVGLSKRLATEAGVADISQANVLALFLLPTNMLQLRSKFLDLQPGSRIVSNTFSIEGWTADEMVTLPNCSSWCTALLYIVPAKVAGTWRVPQGELVLKQEFQMVTGTLTSGTQSTPVTGRLRGPQITLSFGGQELTGRVNVNAIEGTLRSGSAQNNWTATRAGS